MAPSSAAGTEPAPSLLAALPAFFLRTPGGRRLLVLLSLALMGVGAVLHLVVFSTRPTDGREDMQPVPAMPRTLLPAQLSTLANVSQLEALTRPLLIHREVGSSGHKLAREHITSVLAGAGFAVAIDKFKTSTPHGAKVFRSIVAILDPRAARRVVLSAHYESKIFSDPAKAAFIGAIDSAVPCGVLLDLAVQLAPLLQARRAGRGTTLQLIFFDGEEAFEDWTPTDSIYGARHLATKMAKTQLPAELVGNIGLTELRAMDVLVLLDLLGTPYPQIASAFPETDKHHAWLATVEQRLAAAGLLEADHAAPWLVGQRRGAQVEDDHVPFLRRGVPVLHLIPVPFPRQWHDSSDNEAAVDWAVSRDWARLMRVFTCELLHCSLE